MSYPWTASNLIEKCKRDRGGYQLSTQPWHPSTTGRYPLCKSVTPIGVKAQVQDEEGQGDAIETAHDRDKGSIQV